MGEGIGLVGVCILAVVLPLQLWQDHRRRFREFDAAEQNLCRAGQGFALVIAVFAFGFFMRDAGGVGNFVLTLITDPRKVWAYGALFSLLVAYGLIRGIIGTRRLAGVRDGLRMWGAFVRIAGGLGAIGYLWWGHGYGDYLGHSTAAGALLMVLLIIAGLYTLTGTIRFLVLSLPRAAALVMVWAEIKRQEFSWGDEDDGRRWWQFWKRRQ